MQKAVRYLETGSVDPFFNLAFEEYVLQNRKQGDYLILWQNENTVVIGQNQNAEAEINRSFVERHNVKVVRRTTGGGAVYHDLGNLNYSFITDAGELSTLTMSRFTDAVVKALESLGLQSEASGRNDILVNGKKVSGTAQRVVGGRILYHGTLLFDSDPDMVAGALNADPAKFVSKSSKSVRSRIGNIRQMLAEDMTLRQFWDRIKNELSGGGFTADSLSKDELKKVDQLVNDKYSRWEWNFGRSPKYELTNKQRYSGGTLEVSAKIESGIITDIIFYGDFMAVAPLYPILDALKGTPFKREEDEKILSEFSVSDMFGTITMDEILDTVFHAGDC